MENLDIPCGRQPRRSRRVGAPERVIRTSMDAIEMTMMVKNA